MDISYFGHAFCGFARQPEQLTVQGNLETAIERIFGQHIDTTCAGRTDSGVHARHQFVSFEIQEFQLKGRTERSICNSLDSLTHDDIHVNSAEFKSADFSARFDAKQRYYSYFIANQKHPSIFMRETTWHVPFKLDIDSMKQASKYLVGEHDFKSFCVAASSKDKPTHRHISDISFVEHDIFDDKIIEIKVSGNAFLHSMVRTLVGTLIKVGTGHREPAWVLEVLQARDRQAAGECAPAKGLVLMDVQY